MIASFNQAVKNHDLRVQVGTVVLEKGNYDPNTKQFTLQIKTANWIKNPNFLPKATVIEVSRDEAKKLFEEGSQKPLFAINGEQQNKDTVWSMYSFILGLGKEIQLPSISYFMDKLKDDSFGPEMVWISAGTFQMGSNDGNSDEKPVHTVSVKSFALGKYEVTFEEYDKFCEATGREKPKDEGWGRGKRPVINVNWNDAKAYTQWLSEQTGKDYRLPSEAQWEYACRAGSTGKYSFGDDANQLGNYGWYDKNSGSQAHLVGEKQPNKFGLYDMHGNVWEWLEDVWHENYNGAPSDASAWMSGGEPKYHLLRGGSWGINGNDLRCADRDWDVAANWSYYGGLRISRM